MKIGVKVKTEDKGMLAMERVYTELNELRLRVGWQDERTHQIALYNHVTRPFVTTTTDGNITKYGALYGEVVGDALDGRMTPTRALEWLGREVESDISAAIEDWDEPPNAASTVEQKGFNDPLVWTGRMAATVDHAVVRVPSVTK